MTSWHDESVMEACAPRESKPDSVKRGGSKGRNSAKGIDSSRMLCLKLPLLGFWCHGLNSAGPEKCLKWQ